MSREERIKNEILDLIENALYMLKETTVKYAPIYINEISVLTNLYNALKEEK